MQAGTQDVDELRALEVLCVSRVARIHQKLKSESALFARERMTLLLHWERALCDTRAQLAAAGQPVAKRNVSGETRERNDC